MLDSWFYEHPDCTDRYIVVSLSSDRCNYFKSLWIKAKLPKCKCEPMLGAQPYQCVPRELGAEAKPLASR